MTGPYGHWAISEEFSSYDYRGFVYLIECAINGRKYIGQKSFSTLHCNWKSYTGSCNELNTDIQRLGKENFRFSILHLCKTLEELNDCEVSVQRERNVLDSLLPNGVKEYYNKYVHRTGFNLPATQYKERSAHILESRRKNKRIKDSFVDGMFEFTNRKTGETVKCSAKEFSDKISRSLIDCIKLTTGTRKLLSNWFLSNNGEKKFAPNMDNNVYMFKNLETGEVISGSQSFIRNKISATRSMLSTVICGNKKYVNGWIMCDSNGNTLSDTVDKRSSVTGNSHHLSDKTLYSIYNFNTGEVFLGTRADICKKLNASKADIAGLVHCNIKIYKDEWALYNYISKEKPEYKPKGRSGIHNNNADKSVYVVCNRDTNEMLSGTRVFIRETTGMTVQQCCHLVKYKKIIQNWQYVGVYHE